MSPCSIHGEETVSTSRRISREYPASYANLLFLRDTKVDGYARYQVRIVNSERAWDGLVVVLVDRSTDGQMLSGKVGNQGPRDPLQGRRDQA